jgi:hypothetical protein
LHNARSGKELTTGGRGRSFLGGACGGKRDRPCSLAAQAAESPANRLTSPYPTNRALPTMQSETDRPFLSLILPVLNEAATIVAQLATLQELRSRGVELLVVDGGSSDATRELAQPAVDRLIESPRGRAAQMNAGARASQGRALLFLHADTTLPPLADDVIRRALAAGAAWGRFDVCTGDQAIFVRRDVFVCVGGFPDLPLMEDIALSKLLKRSGRPACLCERVRTSGRRWETHGVLRTVVLMWCLRASYFLGADPEHLAMRYGYLPRQR